MNDEEKIKEEDIKENESLWSEGAFVQSMSQKEMEEKEKTIHMKHDEDMNYECKKCGKKISAHNKDWHNYMCDECFDKECFPEENLNEKSGKPEKIWKENEETANELADCYYDSLLEAYKDIMEKDTKENFGFNIFLDGIRMGLDIVLPLLDEENTEKVKQKIKYMIEKRTKINKEKIIKVNCSFCNKEIECLEQMKNTEKHSCFQCFKKLGHTWTDEEFSKIHIDAERDQLDKEMPQILMDSLIKEDFPKIWKISKLELKNISKKELAEEMFKAGIESMMNIMGEKNELLDEEQEEMKK